MATISFRGVTIWDETTNGAGCKLTHPVLKRGVQVQAPAQGDGEFVKELGQAGGDGSLELVYRATDAGLGDVYTLLESVQGAPRGTLVTPEGTVPNCLVTDVSAPVTQRVRLQSGALGWLVRVTLTIRRSA